MKAVKRAFGLLKRRWMILSRELEVDSDRLPMLMLAMMKLHNLCVQRLKHKSGLPAGLALLDRIEHDLPADAPLEGKFDPAPNEFSKGFKSQLEALRVQRRTQIMRRLAQMGHGRAFTRCGTGIPP